MLRGRILLWVLLILLPGFPLRGQEAPQRVISLAPHITEIIFRIGAGERLVGRTNYCRFPPAARKIESVGAYLDLNYEKIVRLNPEVVFQFPNPEHRRKLEQLGFRVVDVPNETVEQILAGIRRVGQTLGLTENAEQVCRDIQDTLQWVEQTAQHLSHHFSALLLIGKQPGSLNGLYAAGSGSYLSELWERCGGVNAFGEVEQNYFPLSKEELVKRAPEVILFFHPDSLSPGEVAREKNLWQAFPTLPAVRQQRIFILRDDYFLIPGPRITRIALRFRDLLQQLDRQP